MPGPIFGFFWHGRRPLHRRRRLSFRRRRPPPPAAPSSGFVSSSSLDVADIADKVMRRCGLQAAKQTPEIVKIIRENLFLFLSTMVNREMGLWCINRELYGYNVGQSEYPLATGSVEVLHANHRTPARRSATIVSSLGGTTDYLTDGDVETVFSQTAVNGNIVFDLGTSDTVFMLGLLPGDSSAHVLAIEVSTDGTTWRDVINIAVTFEDRSWLWYQLEPAIAGRYLRITEECRGQA
jgi:hypothetical protein